MEKCFFCNHSMNETESKTVVENGETRQLTEYECTNPECNNVKVVDEPYEF